MKQLNVFVIDGERGYQAMWHKKGHKIVHYLEKADVVQFTGGEDVSPHLYCPMKHPNTYNNVIRDEFELGIYLEAIRQGKYIAGICRGGQFLNVMNGGTMIQHVTGHAIHGTHELTDMVTGEKHQVTSTHHQMMVMGARGELVATANLGGSKDIIVDGVFVTTESNDEDYPDYDTEVVWYEGTKSLCFQPHPELNGYSGCTDYFFSLVERYFQ